MSPMRPPFVPGLTLAAHLYQAVEPLLRQNFGQLTYSAALLGPGSEVLRFDTPRSTDHDWGPRLQLFLSADDLSKHRLEMHDLLAQQLPATIQGYPTNMPTTPAGTRHMQLNDSPVTHAVAITESATWFVHALGIHPGEITHPFDWLAIPTQALAEVTGGRVFHDGLHELEPARQALAWYPDDIWRYVLACQWWRIAEEEPFPARAAEAGDDLGSAMVAARLVRDLVRLCLLMRRRYPPYSKWLGSAFRQLPDAALIQPLLTAALSAQDHATREDALTAAYQAAAATHNDLGLTPPLPLDLRHFHDRPYQVLGADRFAEALHVSIRDPDLRELRPIGAVDQFIDSTALITDRLATRRAARAAHSLEQ
jgi:hypothetical protein